MGNIKQPPKAIGYRKAIDLMGRNDVRLVKMRSDTAQGGGLYLLCRPRRLRRTVNGAENQRSSLRSGNGRRAFPRP